MNLTQDQVQALDYQGCKRALGELARAYRLEDSDPEYIKSVQPWIDDITNTLLYLEDRIKLFEDPRMTTMTKETTE